MTETKSLFKSGLKDEAMIVNFMDGSLYSKLKEAMANIGFTDVF